MRPEPEGIEPLKLDRALADELDVVDHSFVHELSVARLASVQVGGG